MHFFNVSCNNLLINEFDQQKFELFLKNYYLLKRFLKVKLQSSLQLLHMKMCCFFILNQCVFLLKMFQLACRNRGIPAKVA